LREIPSLQDLKEPFCSRADLVLARVSPTCRNELAMAGATVACQRWLEVGAAVDVDDTSIFFVAARASPRRLPGTSEDLVHCLVHPLILMVLEELSTASEKEDDRFSLLANANVGGHVVATLFEASARTSKDQGSTNVQGSSRIDVTATLAPTRGLVFFGELKAGTETIAEAEKQLRDKERVVYSVAHYGTAPYILVFACAGPRCQFYTFRRGNELDKLWTELDLVRVDDRVELVARVHYVFRLLRACARRHFPTLPAPRSKAQTIELKDGFVTKRLSLQAMTHIHAAAAGSDGGDVYGVGKTKEQWLQLYEDLEERDGPQELIRGEFIDSSSSVTSRGHLVVRDACLHIRPVGFLRPPQTSDEARALFRDVLRGLAWLHERRWVHRDVRIYNILRRDAEPAAFVLIDYELAAVMDERGHAPWPADAILDPTHTAGLRRLSVNGRPTWTAQHDLEQLGLLVFDALRGTATTADRALRALPPVPFSEELLAFREALRDEAATAAALLQEFF
jgi:hypothetical protein